MNRGSIYFVVAAAFAIAALINFLDYGDGANDGIFLVLEIAAAAAFLILGLRAGRSKA